MKIKGLNKIFIIHYAKLKDRKAYLDNKIKELDISDFIEWNIAPENEVLTKKDLAFYDKSDVAWNERIKTLGSNAMKLKRELNKSVIAVTLQHMRTIFKIAKMKKGIYMIIEDDAVLNDDFKKNLEKIISKLNNKKWDICYTDKGGLFSKPKVDLDKDGIGFYKPEDRNSNTTGSYLLTTECAKKFYKYMKKFVFAIDIEIAYVQRRFNFDVLWSIPFLTKQGSIEGIYLSNIRGKTMKAKANQIISSVNKFSPTLSSFIDSLISNGVKNEQ